MADFYSIFFLFLIKSLNKKLKSKKKVLMLYIIEKLLYINQWVCLLLPKQILKST